jgi:hypothetical protein
MTSRNSKITHDTSDNDTSGAEEEEEEEDDADYEDKDDNNNEAEEESCDDAQVQSSESVSGDDEADDKLGSYCVWLKVKTPSPATLAKAAAAAAVTNSTTLTLSTTQPKRSKQNSGAYGISNSNSSVTSTTGDDSEQQAQPDSEDDTSTATNVSAASSSATAASKTARRRRKPRSDNSRTVIFYGPVRDVPLDHTPAIIIGGFVHKSEAIAFASSWTHNTRGPIGRFIQAIRLLRELPHNHMFVDCVRLFMINPIHWIFTVEQGKVCVTRVHRQARSIPAASS